jgi:hypothetical protein
MHVSEGMGYHTSSKGPARDDEGTSVLFFFSGLVLSCAPMQSFCSGIRKQAQPLLVTGGNPCGQASGIQVVLSLLIKFVPTTPRCEATQ